MIKRARGIPFELDKKVTPGLNYLSYGMDDSGRQRYYLPAGATWKLVMTARPSRCATLSLTSEKVMEQATSALWLLCQFGGLGSKSRKGFGCLALDGDASQPLSASQVQERLAVIRSQAADLRKSIGFGGGFQVQQAVPGSLELMLPLVELDLGQRDPFIAIHLLGGSVQKFASSLKHQSVKAALGLPRSIDMNPQAPSPRPQGRPPRRSGPVSPVPKDGRYAVRVTALPVPTLRKLEESTTVLGNLLESLKTDLPQRVAGFKPARLNAAPQRFSGPKHVNVPSAPVDKTEEGELLAEKTKKLAGWSAGLAQTAVVR
jgi:CRISPR-associated protein Cmr6